MFILIILFTIIDLISVGTTTGEGISAYSEINAQEQIKKMLDLLINIEIKKLSQEQLKEIYKNAKAWSQNVKYEMSLVATGETIPKEPASCIKGLKL